MPVTSTRIRLASAWAILLAVVFTIVLSQAPGAEAQGEGVFTLNLNKYEVVEGEAFDVVILRTGGATLAQDVTVTVQLCTTDPLIPGCHQSGIAGVDFPEATVTQQVVFPAGSNLPSQTVRFQSLNRSRIYNTVCGDGVAIPPTAAFPAPEDCTLTTSVVIQSVTHGSIGTPDWSPLLIRGRGAPIVTNIFPHSGAPGSQVQIHGANFSGISINGETVAVDRVEFRPKTGGAATNAPAFNVTSPNLMTATVPAGLVDAAGEPEPDFAATYDVVVVSTLVGVVPAQFGESLEVPEDEFVNTTGRTVNGLSKRTGPTTGGTELRVFGTNFVASDCTGNGTESRVTFEAAAVASADCTFITSNELLIITPPAPLGFSGVTNVRVGATPAELFPTPPDPLSPATVDNEFTYAGAPKITSINPAFGPTSGGTTVEIIGTGFTTIPGTVNAVAFGGTPAASFIVHSDTRITAVSPPLISDVDTPVQIRVTHPGTGTSPVTTAATFTYVVGPLIQGLNPSSGPPQGGTLVTISGNGFSPGATVTFGGVPAPFVNVESQNQIRVTSPAGSGTVDVVVTVGGKSSPSTAQSKFQYAAATITAVKPNAGPTAGGTFVTIEGTNFQVGTKVRFGTLVVDATFVTPLMITAVSPGPAAAGIVDVIVETPSGNSPVSDDAKFTYTDGPIVSSLNPASGPTVGGTIVIISGSNFVEGATVVFGGTPAVAASFNAGTGQITALSPAAAAAGPAQVRVTTPAGISPVTDAAEFTYGAAKPVITAITPNSGTVFGGETVVISGVGFLGTVCPGGILFGTSVVQQCTVINDTTIQVTTPPGQSGPTVVVVTTPNGTSEIVENFTYTKTGSGTTPPPAGGGGDGPSQPPTGEQVSYLLYPGWNTVFWRGPNEAPINAALVDGAGNSLVGIVVEIHLLDTDTQTYLIYAPGRGMFEFGFLKKDTVYWFLVAGDDAVTLVTTDN